VVCVAPTLTAGLAAPADATSFTFVYLSIALVIAFTFRAVTLALALAVNPAALGRCRPFLNLIGIGKCLGKTRLLMHDLFSAHACIKWRRENLLVIWQNAWFFDF